MDNQSQTVCVRTLTSTLDILQELFHYRLAAAHELSAMSGCSVLCMVMEHTILFSLIKQEPHSCFLTPPHNANHITKGGVVQETNLKTQLYPTVDVLGTVQEPLYCFFFYEFTSWFWNPHVLLIFSAKVFCKSDTQRIKKHLSLYALYLQYISCIIIITGFMHPVLVTND